MTKKEYQDLVNLQRETIATLQERAGYLEREVKRMTETCFNAYKRENKSRTRMEALLTGLTLFDHAFDEQEKKIESLQKDLNTLATTAHAENQKEPEYVSSNVGSGNSRDTSKRRHTPDRNSHIRRNKDSR